MCRRYRGAEDPEIQLGYIGSRGIEDHHIGVLI